MCITLSAAELSSTKLYAGEAMIGKTYVHVIAYQNKAITNGPNAMVLPIPAAVTPGPENVIDTRGFPCFLDDIHESTKIPSFGIEDDGGVEVFDVGSYSVVLANAPGAIASAVASIPGNKRPTLNSAVIAAFGELYPGWPLAVCCWDGAIEAEPLLWWYEPRLPEWLFAPALDAHGGAPPDVTATVWVDHHIAFGAAASMMKQWDRIAIGASTPMFRPWDNSVRYQGTIPQVAQDLLPECVRGTRVVGSMVNGDFWASTTDPEGLAFRQAPLGEARSAVPLEGWA